MPGNGVGATLSRVAGAAAANRSLLGTKTVSDGASLQATDVIRQARSAEFQTRLRALGLALRRNVPAAIDVLAIASVRMVVAINTCSVMMPS